MPVPVPIVPVVPRIQTEEKRRKEKETATYLPTLSQELPDVLPSEFHTCARERQKARRRSFSHEPGRGSQPPAATPCWSFELDEHEHTHKIIFSAATKDPSSPAAVERSRGIPHPHPPPWTIVRLSFSVFSSPGKHHQTTLLQPGAQALQRHRCCLLPTLHIGLDEARARERERKRKKGKKRDRERRKPLLAQVHSGRSRNR